MAVIVKRLNYPAASASGGGGGSSSSVEKYIHPFIISDWVLYSSDYKLLIPIDTHQKGLNPTVTVYLDTSITFEEVEVNLSSSPTGTISISVTSNPDNRFKGKLIII